MNWYVIHTKPRQEHLAEASLQRLALETFHPRLRRRRTVRRVRKWVTCPLFPNYIFARFDAEKSRRAVKYANGVANIVSFGGVPAIVDDSLIKIIADRAEEDIVTIQPPTLKPGDIVEIQEGPFQGLQGIFERELSGPERVMILLEALAQGIRVEVSRESLEKIV